MTPGKSIKPPPQTPIEILQGIPIKILQGIRNLNKGCWHSVSRTQFDTYYASQELGIGLWVGAAELLLSSHRTRADFARNLVSAGNNSSNFNN